VRVIVMYVQWSFNIQGQSHYQSISSICRSQDNQSHNRYSLNFQKFRAERH